MIIKLILIILSLVLSSMADFNKSDESRLRKTLLNNYEIDLRPIKNSTTVTNISVSISNVQIMGLDEQNQIILIGALVIFVIDLSLKILKHFHYI